MDIKYLAKSDEFEITIGGGRWYMLGEIVHRLQQGPEPNGQLRLLPMTVEEAVTKFLVRAMVGHV